MNDHKSKMSAVLVFVLTLVLTVTGIPVAFAAEIDKVGIPDENLKKALIDAGADIDGDGELTEGEMASLTDELNLSGKSISSLTGLGYATGVTILNLSGNNISDISDLSALSNLTSLDLSNNALYHISALYDVDAPPETLALLALNVTYNYLNTRDGSDDRTVIDVLTSKGCSVLFDTQKEVAASGIELSQSEIELCPGDDYALTAAVLPDEANQECTWQSSNKSVATVANGTVKAKSIGTAVITVTTLNGSLTDTCTVSVCGDKLVSSVYDVRATTLRNVRQLTTVEQFKKKFSNDSSKIYVYDTSGNECADMVVTTGMTVKLVVGGIERDKKAIIVRGDASGDGVITLEDYTRVKLHLLGSQTLQSLYAGAGDYNTDGKLTVADYVRLRLSILKMDDDGGSLPNLPEVSDPRIKKFLNIALAQLGKPYVWGAEGPDSFDCSGFVYYCLNKSGYKVGRTTANTYSKYENWKYVDKDDLQPGDLMFYFSDSADDGDRIGHIGIYLGNGFHVHASSDYGCIIICGLEGWYERMLSHGRRVFS